MTQPLAKIYQPAKTAMQSGKAGTKFWVLEFVPNSRMTPDPLMGWNTMNDTLGEVKLRFPTCEDAEEYAKAKGITYIVKTPKIRAVKPKSYAANFLNNRVTAFTENK